MKQRTMEEMISYFNQQVSEMDIKREDKIKLLGMITAIGYENKKLERKTGRWNRLMMYLADLQLTYAPMGGHGDIRLYEFVTGLIEELEGWEDGGGA